MINRSGSAPKARNLSAIFFLVLLISPSIVIGQVSMRDSVISWTHHAFELNDDGSMKSFSSNDNDLQTEIFNAKVLENDLIRLVLVPEYGGRVISFFYKPTNHEYLYNSVNGSPYGMRQGNFYYDWLMVWGGIFPTFPEPEHGKTWFLPWDFSVIQNTDETITVRMEYTDDTMFSGAPGGFNNGITQITCRVDLSIYSNSSLWDYQVTLINNRSEQVNYEYWTCTTLAPGSVPNDTGTPLNSEIIVPIEEYTAGWSPGGWIGNFNGTYDLNKIDYLSDWTDMGIGYSKDLNDRYWGVINHENEEGVFRISDNIETPGMKFWTWGKNNVDNDLFDFSNGGADNYIELWGGVSNSFFSDAVLAPNEIKTWVESYSPTINMAFVDEINESAAVNLIWDESSNEVSYELNTFQSDQNYTVSLRLEADQDVFIGEEQVAFNALGQVNSFSLDELTLTADSYVLVFELLDVDNNIVLTTSEIISPSIVTATEDQISNENKMILQRVDANNVRILLPKSDQYELRVITLNGQNVHDKRFTGNTFELYFQQRGLFIIQVTSAKSRYSAKFLVR